MSPPLRGEHSWTVTLTPASYAACGINTGLSRRKETGHHGNKPYSNELVTTSQNQLVWLRAQALRLRTQSEPA